MPNPYDRLIWALPPAGMAAGAVVWLIISAAASPAPALAELGSRLSLSAPRPRHTGLPGPSNASSISVLLAHPILQISVGEAGADPKLRLEGIALTSTRSAALLAIGNTAAAWLQLGESRSGVTLRRVERQGVVVESLTGEHGLALGNVSAVSPALTSASPLETASGTQVRSTAP